MPSTKVDEAGAVIGDEFNPDLRLTDEPLDPSRAAPVVLTPKPMEGFAAGTHVLVSGTCRENATVEVFTQAGKWGDALVVGTRWFFYRVWGQPWYDPEWWGWVGRGAEGGFVHAVQVVNGLRSEPSLPRLFTIGRMQISPTPEVAWPKDGSEVPVLPTNTINDRGYVLVNCDAGANVELLAEGVLPLGIGGQERNGMCIVGRVVRPGQTFTYQYRQTSPGLLPSDFSLPVTLSYVAASPEKSTVESNACADKASANVQKPNAPSISTPVNGDSRLLVRFFRIEGACEEGALVQYEINGVYRYTALVVGTTWHANSLGVFGSETIRARQRVNDSEFSEWSEPVTVSVFPIPPLLLSPLSGTSHPVSVPLYLSGVCDRGAMVQIFTEDGSFISDAMVKDTTWVYHQTWSRGVHRVKARQHFQGYTTGFGEVIEFAVLD
ncbi:hypothetical protein ACVWYU_001398 [Pseudomonas sp. TE12234]